mgnify:CR=1 FL=1
MAVEGKIAYHLFKMISHPSKNDDRVKPYRKPQWQFEYTEFDYLDFAIKQIGGV